MGAERKIPNNKYYQGLIMHSTKTILVGLTTVSLCMGAISGRVIDASDALAIAGALVQLEKGGQQATTDANGNFTINTSAVTDRTGQSLLPTAAVSIQGSFLRLDIAEKSPVVIALYDISGKVHSKVQKYLVSGVHTFALSKKSTGIYLYKVSIGTAEVILKWGTVCNSAKSVGEIAEFSSGKKNLTKRSLTTIAFNDVLTAYKKDYLNYRSVIKKSDTLGVIIRMIANAGSITDIDGNVYSTVTIGTQTWTAENLRVTKYNDGSEIQKDTSTVNWTNAITPKYCFFNNTSNADSIIKYGALYNWYVIAPANANKIAPAGWHIPTSAEWDTLQNYLIANRYNWDETTTGNKVGKSLAAKVDWYMYTTVGAIGNNLALNNTSGFSALPGGARSGSGVFSNIGKYGIWWSSTETGAPSAYGRILNYNFEDFDISNYYKSIGFSVRLIKNL